MKFTRSFVIYAGSSGLASATPILLLPLLTKVLNEADYGSIATVTAVAAFLTPVILWGTHALIAVDFNRKPRGEFAEFLTSLLVLPALAFVSLMLLAKLVATQVSRWLDVPEGWILATPVLALVTALPVLQLTILRMRGQAFTYGAIEIATALVTVAATYLFVVEFAQGWQGRLHAALFAGALASLFGLLWLAFSGQFAPKIRRKSILEGFKFGGGVVPHDLFNQVIRLADRLILVSLAGLAAAGQYAVASQVASMLLVLLAAFNRAWSPYLFARLPTADEADRIGIVRKSYAVIGAFALFCVVFNLLVPVVYDVLIDRKFHESAECLPWLSLGYAFMAAYLTCIDYIFYEKKTYLLSGITLCNMLINVGLNGVLVPVYGAKGAAMAFALTMGVVMVLAFVVSSRVHSMPWFYWVRRTAP